MMTQVFLRLLLYYTGAPHIMLDPFSSEVKCNEGEPFRVKVPFKGSPAPTAVFSNVSPCLSAYSLYLSIYGTLPCYVYIDMWAN